jgi:ABC-2 type transport system permease protein
MKALIHHIKTYRFLLGELVKKGIRLKYRRSYLGVIWSLIEPILTTIVLVIVFGTLFNNKKPTFPLYIISGRLIYSAFSTSTKAAAKSIRKNSSMIKKVYVPKYLYPLSSVLFNYVIFLISLLVLVLVAVYCRTMPTLLIWQCLAAISLLLILTIGVGMILATMDVFFRDTEYLWNVVLMIIMYMCAIFYYPERLLNSGFAWVLNYNPLYCIINIFRGGVLGYMAPGWDYGYAVAFSILAMLVGLIVFKKKQDEFILHI